MGILDPQKRVTIVFGATSERARHRFSIGPGAAARAASRPISSSKIAEKFSAALPPRSCRCGTQPA